jgi:hypothetical protein
MAIYECRNCRKFASLGPGLCWKCGHGLSPKDEGGAAPNNAASGGGMPPPGSMPLYRCGKCNKFAALSPGICLLCNAPLTVDYVPAGAAAKINQLLQQASNVVSNMQTVLERVRSIQQELRQLKQSVSYQYTPSLVYNSFYGDPLETIREKLSTARDELKRYRDQLVMLQRGVEQTGALSPVQTLATIDARQHAGRLMNMIKEMLTMLNTSIEAIDMLIAELG